MRVVMGEMNGVRLANLMSDAKGVCSRITAAVAYATPSCTFFDYCLANKIFVDFFGLLDEGEAVSIAVLEQLLKAGPLAVNARVVKGHFHSKVIWWHGFGAYIGSANLTAAAWDSNVECGVFFSEEEIIGKQIQVDLEQMFDYLKAHSSPVDKELVETLNSLHMYQVTAFRAKQKLESQFDLVTRNIQFHSGLVARGPGTRTTAFVRFATEWSETLELLRGLCNEFHKLNKRPVWIASDANRTVHFDQFLHALYYVRIREGVDDDESAKTVERVNRAFQKNRADPRAALQEAVAWWASLPSAPYGEDSFIHEGAPKLEQLFAKNTLATWVIEDFQNAFFEVNAFKMHARQVRNKVFGLPQDHHESMLERSNRLARWLWERPREAGQEHVRDLLQFLVWGTSPSNMAERLWLVTTEEKWRYEHLGPSSLGEAVGWARPDMYPPRNNRTNKALRCLGHDVRLFGS